MSESRGNATPVLAGWREWVALPDLNVLRIKAKLDTGARTSTIHAPGLTSFRQDGVPMVRFQVHPLQRTDAATIVTEAEVFDERLVRNSGGAEELRPVVLTRLSFQGHVWPIELTLTSREAMGFRLLLGREALRGRVVVDPSRGFLAGRGKRWGSRRARRYALVVEDEEE